FVETINLGIEKPLPFTGAAVVVLFAPRGLLAPAEGIPVPFVAPRAELLLGFDGHESGEWGHLVVGQGCVVPRSPPVVPGLLDVGVQMGRLVPHGPNG